MELMMKISKWGNSLAVRLPTEMIAALSVKEGDEIELHPAEPGHFYVARKLTGEELLERIKKYRGTLPADFKFNREEANERSE